MPSRNIAIRKDVYDALRRDRRTGESFTKVLARLLAQRGPMAELHGAWGARPSTEERRRWARLRSPVERGR